MRTLFYSTVAALALFAPPSAHAANFVSLINDTGCNSRYSDEKKASIAAPYIGKQMTVTGTLSYISGGQVGIRVLPSTLTYDVLISLADPKAGFDLEKERTITVTFVLNNIGGCILPYVGDQGTVN